MTQGYALMRTSISLPCLDFALNGMRTCTDPCYRQDTYQFHPADQAQKKACVSFTIWPSSTCVGSRQGGHVPDISPHWSFMLTCRSGCVEVVLLKAFVDWLLHTYGQPGSSTMLGKRCKNATGHTCLLRFVPLP